MKYTLTMEKIKEPGDISTTDETSTFEISEQRYERINNQLSQPESKPHKFNKWDRLLYILFIPMVIGMWWLFYQIYTDPGFTLHNKMFHDIMSVICFCIGMYGLFAIIKVAYDIERWIKRDQATVENGTCKFKVQ